MLFITFSLCNYFSCAPPPAVSTDKTFSYNSINKKDGFQTDIQGNCTVSTRKETVKAFLRATVGNEIVNAVLMDELGIALTTIESSDSSVKLLRYFPPISKKNGKIFGLGITFLMRSFQSEFPVQGVIVDTSIVNTYAYYFFSDSSLDSIVVQKNRKYYTLQPELNSFSLLNNKSDTVCNCVWEHSSGK